MPALANELISRLTPASSVHLLLVAFVLYRIGVVIWRLFFHPLAGFPGPKLYAASYLPFTFQNYVMGTLVKESLNLHKKYGPIVRVSPTRLAIDGSIAWPEIFTRRPHQAEFEKTVEFYGLSDRIGIFPTYREDHRRQRRIMAHAFSEAALTEQESYVKSYVDLLMLRLGEQAQQGKISDIAKWYNCFTFDVIGELAFADPFYSLEKSDYHPWIAMIFFSIKANSRIMFLFQYSFLRPFLLLVGSKTMRMKDESENLAREKTDKRLALRDDNRKDFMSYILRNNKEDGNGMSHEEIHANSRAFIVAGSETTATALSGLTFHLTRNPDVYRNLVQEIREAFASEEEITTKSTKRLTYLHACLEETLRIYPPAAETPPRVSPGDVIDGKFIPKGTYISVYQWATHHNPLNFADPDAFRPQRFLPVAHPLYESRYSTDNKAAFRPFSTGPRDCIGKNLAYAEMQVVAARLLWSFDIELQEGQEDWVSSQATFTVYHKGPLMVKLKPRAK
ncbi:cytochrome P450 CYP561D2P [Colletotrichum navitas]|uniref:Cytochrome P450 CYP561D2P n=1 Tax=Colletotrichum navitas TaxID=681940 RepID=A0AAD8PSE3_9PEZI|nr:cytochrome P450 CYP561D2P [Colletotrichum navitas]KAK1579224.1 cytochrome P450 CYP561D2P [Colletotrichum navitas]